MQGQDGFLSGNDYIDGLNQTAIDIIHHAYIFAEHTVHECCWWYRNVYIIVAY